jgi:hypothetical protein
MATGKHSLCSGARAAISASPYPHPTQARAHTHSLLPPLASWTGGRIGQCRRTGQGRQTDLRVRRTVAPWLLSRTSLSDLRGRGAGACRLDVTADDARGAFRQPVRLRVRLTAGCTCGWLAAQVGIWAEARSPFLPSVLRNVGGRGFLVLFVS